MKSIWSENCKFNRRDELNGDVKTDILIIGAGIAGIFVEEKWQRSSSN